MPSLSNVYLNPRVSHRSCRKCDTAMRLVQIEPFDRRDYDLRIFECRKCWYSENLIVQSSSLAGARARLVETP
jgi:hypothetical protein